MTTEFKSIVARVDDVIRRELWFDFQVLQYDGFKLIIAGGTDLTYYHTLEIIFEDVYFFSGFLNGWHSDTSAAVFKLPGNETELNERYEIEKGYQLFIFETEDYKRNIVIAARNVSFNTNTVFHYDRQNRAF